MALTGTVQRFEKLPEAASFGSIYRIAGGTEGSFVPYYVKKSAEGIWDETVLPGLVNQIDPTSMPHALIRQSDGSFLFAPFAWDERKVGDTETNPDPGFIGRSIRKVFVNQNRLAFLYDENVVLSGAGDFGRFYRLSVLDYIESDPIDVAATSSKVSILQEAVPFNDGVMLFSDQTQFSMTNGEAGLTASSLAVRPVTHYETSKRVSPVPLGSEVYFASDSSGHATVLEYTRTPDSDATSASDITAHVRRYVPAGVTRMIPCGDLNALFVLTDGDPSAIYVYQVYWLDGANKAQTAWHRWVIDPDSKVISGGYQSGKVTFVISRPSGVYLEQVDLTKNSRPGLTDGFPYLDRRVSLTGTYSEAEDRTTFALPYTVEDPERFLLVRSEGFPGSLGATTIHADTYVWLTDSTVAVPGNQTAGPVYAGLRYAFRYRFSRPYMRRQDGTAITSGRLQLRTLRLTYRDTTSFDVIVHPYGPGLTEPRTFQYRGLITGLASLNSRPAQTGTTPIQIGANAEVAEVEIVNDSPFGCAFQSAEWETFFWSRARP